MMVETQLLKTNKSARMKDINHKKERKKEVEKKYDELQ